MPEIVTELSEDVDLELKAEARNTLSSSLVRLCFGRQKLTDLLEPWENRPSEFGEDLFTSPARRPVRLGPAVQELDFGLLQLFAFRIVDFGELGSKVCIRLNRL